MNNQNVVTLPTVSKPILACLARSRPQCPTNDNAMPNTAIIQHPTNAPQCPSMVNQCRLNAGEVSMYRLGYGGKCNKSLMISIGAPASPRNKIDCSLIVHCLTGHQAVPEQRPKIHLLTKTKL